jgi:Ca2+-binding RTX toxin-like protein
MVITGTAASETLNGTADVDQISGLGGDDFIRGLAGADLIDGGTGSDMTSYDNDAANGGTGAVIVNLSANSVTVGGTTVASNTAIDGFGSVDTLISIEQARGTAGADRFIGGIGSAFFQGRAGADTYISNLPVQFIDNFYVNGFAAVDYRQDGGGSGINVNLATGTGTDTWGTTETFTNIVQIRGSMFGDTIVGNQFYNYFQGLQGADNINGGGGFDEVDYSLDANYGGAAGVTVNLVNGVATDGWGNIDTLTSIEYVRGTQQNDTITGNASNNVVRGNGGSDSFVGGDGFDTFLPGLGVDSFNASAGADGDETFTDRDRINYGDLTPDVVGLGVIVNFTNASVTREGFTVLSNTARDTGGSIDTFIDVERGRGTSGRDYFFGSTTANLREERFEGLGGSDYFDGGAGFNFVTYGFDVANFASTGSGGTLGIIANLSASSITVNGVVVASGTVRDPFGAIDTLVSIQGIQGTSLADYMVGGSGYDFFRSFGGADVFDGGAGDRDAISFFFDEAFFGIGGAPGYSINMVTGTAVGFADGSTTTFFNVEEVQGSERNDTITGDSLRNFLSGSWGDDVINGGGGNDIIGGGEGNDTLNGEAGVDSVTYMYDPFARSYLYSVFTAFVPATNLGVTVNLATGTATDQYGDTDTLSGIENVTGTFFNDTLTGDGNANTFYGLSGNDTIDGGTGNDTISYAGWGANDGSGIPALVGQNASRPNGVTVNLVGGTANDSEGGTDTLISIESVIGSTGNDTITGNTSDNTLDGGDGNDTLVGGAGSDTLIGGIGTDTASYASASSSIQIYLTAPSFNGGDAGGDTFNSIEVFTLASTSLNNFFADDTAQTVNGGGASDLIFGYGGADTLNGNAGNDFLYGGDDNDMISGGTEDDILVADAGEDTVDGGDGFDQIYGGTGNDTLNGDAGADYIFGNGDNDTINGGAGQDLLFGDSGNDTINGGADYDLIQGGEGSDTLFGGDGAGIVNAVFGQDGNDTLRGGTGIDYMWGGDGAVDTGNDTFEITANGSVDVILDFQAGAAVGDVLRITGTANTSFAQMQGAGQFVQVGTYTGVIISAGNVVYLANTTVAQLNANDFLFA